ncbi:cysteine proteinase inhibitor 1-like [Primulina eburnea]|uniref:cysteine proteinase inhibitor 1-like n=1 Tax=Primulina eburnea TaxID=1245227 RepID=UPI003C6C5D77
MAPKSLSSFLVIYLILLSSAMLGGGKSSSVARWQVISNLKDPEVVEIAKFAVKEYNKRAETILALVSVIKGEMQIVNGKNYRLVIITKDGFKAMTGKSTYRVVVWDKPWKKERRVTSFEKIA